MIKWYNSIVLLLHHLNIYHTSEQTRKTSLINFNNGTVTLKQEHVSGSNL